jgi:adenylate cyclase, class 2
MNYEVEQKFPVADLAALAARLTALGATVSEPQVEVDVYFAHPSRDFAQTDEALRIRRKGTSHFLTYKGPKVDAATKTRRELELPLCSDEESAAAWAGLLQTLDFTPIAEIRKSRRKAHVAWEGRRIEASLDEVAGVGTYAELELVVDQSDIEPAKAHIASLAAALGLSGSERRSYLELLLRRGKPAPAGE